VQRLNKISIINAIHVGMLQELFPSLRAVGIDWDDTAINICCYYHQIISEDDEHSASCLSNEVISRYACKYQINEKCLRLDEPLAIHTHMAIGYMRKEQGRIYQVEKSFDAVPELSVEDVYPKIVFAINQALLNQVTPELRRIDIDWDDYSIHFYVYYYCSLDSYDQEALQEITRYFMSYFPNHTLNLTIKQSVPFELLPRYKVCGYIATEIEPKVEEEDS
jgi:hypothetical protein